MVKKKYLIYGLPAVAIIILMAWFVMAATGDSIKIESPTTGSNFSGANTVIFNVSFLNGSIAGADIYNGSTLNATFYYNDSVTNDWVEFGNSTHCISYFGIASNMSCSVSLNVSINVTGDLIPDGSYLINATIFNGTAATVLLQSVGELGNLTTIIIDNTIPQIFADNFTINSGTNHSGNLILNITFADVTSGTGNVIFNVTNSSTGSQNATFVAVREGGSSTKPYYSISINTSQFIDGKYNITAQVNDTVGNSNNSAVLFSIVFDNTKPSVSHSCSPLSVNTGDIITCTCTGSATSGISSTSFTVNPSTSNTGTLFITTCTVNSHSGLSNSADVTYAVSQSTGGTTTGGGTTTTGTTTGEVQEEDWTTFEFDTEELSDIGSVTQELGELERITVMVSGESHHVGVVSLTENSAVIEIASHAGQIDFSVGDSRDFDVDEDGAFYDLRVTLVSIDAGKANVMVEYIQEEIPQPPEPTPTTPPEEAAGLGALFWVLIIVVVIIVVVIVFWMRKRESSSK